MKTLAAAMASKKKASESIGLLSVYNDEDDDMEDPENEDSPEEEGEPVVGEDDSLLNDFSAPTDPYQENSPSLDEHDPTPKQSQIPQSPSPTLAQRPLPDSQKNRSRVAIVDYGQDEVALSPEPEDGTISGVGRLMLNGNNEDVNGDAQEIDRSDNAQTSVSSISPTFQSYGQLGISHSDATAVNDAANKVESLSVVDNVRTYDVGEEDGGILEKFLPAPLKAKCSDGLQEKINKFLAYKRSGKSFNAEVRNRKEYRNPDFLLHAVRYQDIDQMGSCFNKDVFDPHGYEKSDFYDEIEADMKREMERKELERKKIQKLDFVSGGAQPGNVIPSSNITLPISGATSGLIPAPATSDVSSRESRQNKKSKWDKVDCDRRNPVQSGVQDSASSAGAYAAILSAANAGSGYSAFAQQRRREAEERRSSDRRLERKS